MEQLVIIAKIAYFIRKNLFKKLPLLKEHLDSGNLGEFEKYLKVFTTDLHNKTSKLMLESAASDLQPELRKSALSAGLKKFKLRFLTIQLSTGYRVKLPSLYACEVPENYSKSRHPLAIHWTIIANASPAYVDKVCLSSAACPSYDCANELLSHFGSKQNISRLRKITNDVAIYCKSREVSLTLEEGENVIAKRVLIGTDGGRTRTRLPNEEDATFQTPWCEPKMFVIHIIKEDGTLDKTRLPIYGCRFGEDDMLKLLREYLQTLSIEKCEQVQVVADGAPWIWNSLPEMLRELGVEEQKIVLTLDYYHAVNYVNQLVDKLPKRYSDNEKKEWRVKFKKWLWNGQSDLIVKECKTLFKRTSKLVRRWMNYLDKHLSKTQYTAFKANKLMCGSGIIESGIRRIINLRFKNPSTFWDKETVERLFFFRSTFLSFRWSNFMKNYTASQTGFD